LEYLEFTGIEGAQFDMTTDWSVISQTNSSYVKIKPPQGNISTGIYSDFVYLCLKGNSTLPHSIKVNYLNTDGMVVCSDTLKLEGCNPSDTNTCCQFSGLKIPNGITPNDDGKNDAFVILNTKHCCCISIKVYNRWGNLVFKESDYKNDWKGVNQSGDKLVQGTYFVVIELPNGSKKGSYLDIRY